MQAEWINRVDAAEQMYGTGSAQHKAAQQRYPDGGALAPVTNPQEASMDTTPELRTEAREWIARNGKPNIELVQRAIAHTAACGDSQNINPFRHALITEATR